jgi:hypothetical protein
VTHHDAKTGPLTCHGNSELLDVSLVEIDTHPTTHTIGAET